MHDDMQEDGTFKAIEKDNSPQTLDGLFKEIDTDLIFYDHSHQKYDVNVGASGYIKSNQTHDSNLEMHHGIKRGWL